MDQAELMSLADDVRASVDELYLVVERAQLRPAAHAPYYGDYQQALDRLRHDLNDLSRVRIDAATALKLPSLDQMKKRLRLPRASTTRSAGNNIDAIETLLDDVRHDFSDLVYPLRIVAKWPPDRQEP